MKRITTRIRILNKIFMKKLRYRKNNRFNNRRTKIIFQIILEIVKSIKMKNTFSIEIFII